MDGLTTSGNQWGVNIDRGSRVTFANAAIAEGDSIVFEGQDASGSLTVESGSYQNIKTQGGSTGGTIAINGGTVGSVVNDTAAEITISGGTVTGQVANSGSGSISVTAAALPLQSWRISLSTLRPARTAGKSWRSLYGGCGFKKAGRGRRHL